jgi:hypothetical protein
MSRAFVREPEPGEPSCPGCGGRGEPVGPRTLDALLSPEDRARLGATAFYCDRPACTTGYFNAWAATVPLARLKSAAYPKDPAAPICPCTGLRAEEVLADAREGRKDRVRALKDRPESECALRCPDGRSCVARVFGLFRETYEAR